MCRALEYCKFDFPPSWDCNPDLHLLITYSLVPESQDWSDNDIISEAHLLSHSPVVCRKLTDAAEQFEITFRALPHLNVGIVGISLCCSAPTVECYGGIDGYLCTSHGSSLKTEQDSDIDVDHGNLYFDRIKFDEPVETLSLKFFGLGEDACLKFHKVDFIVQKFNNSPRDGHTGMGSLDLKKVKGYLHSMGDTVSDNARGLLQAIEQYQESQLSTLLRLQTTLTSTSSSADNSDKLSGLLSMVSKQGAKPPVDQSCDQTDEDKQTCESGVVSDECQKINGPGSSDGPMGTLITQMLGGRTPGSNSSGVGDDSVMHQMLQNICKTVSSIRVRETTPPRDVGENANAGEQSSGKETTTDGQTGAAAGYSTEDNCGSVQSIEAEDLKQLKQAVLDEVHASEKRLMSYVDSKLADLETRLNEKLDNILQSLTALR